MATSRDGTIVLMGPHPPLCERAKRAGLDVIVVEAPGRLTPDVVALADHVIATDYTDVERTADLLSVFAKRTPLTGVLSLTEPGLLPSAQVNEALGVDDNPVDVIRRITDKDRMRRWLAADERFAVPARLVRTPAELSGFADRYGLPVIVKPPDGAGSAGVRFVRDRADLADALDPSDGPRLAERFLPGREFSVEAVSLAGRHTVVGITEKLVAGGGPNRFVEVEHRLPARLTEAEAEDLRAFVADFLSTLGLRRGLSHTEVVLGPDGPAVIETHSRNGGDHITDLVRLATGFDLLDFAIAATSGAVTEPPPPPAPTRGAVIRYFTPPPGRVGAVYGHRTARYLPGVVDLQLDLAVGDVVRPLSSSDDRVGYVLAVGGDVTEAARSCAAALDAVTIVVN